MEFSTFTSLIPSVMGLVGLYQWMDSHHFMSSDLKNLLRLIRVKQGVDRHQSNNNTIADVWEEAVDRWGPKPSFLFSGNAYSFIEVESLANRVANWGLSKGLKKV